MQIVIRMERDAGPGRIHICEAVSRSVVELLATAEENPVWLAAVKRWEEGRIRKIVRRARGARWQKVGEYDGVTVEWQGAEARALVPAPVDALPAEIRRLQLNGEEPVKGSGEGLTGGELAGVSGPVLVIAVTPEPWLPLGKAAAAAGHVSQLAWMRASSEERSAWCENQFELRVWEPEESEWGAVVREAEGRETGDRERGGRGIVVADAGFTVVEPGTVTAVGWWETEVA